MMTFIMHRVERVPVIVHVPRSELAYNGARRRAVQRARLNRLRRMRKDWR